VQRRIAYQIPAAIDGLAHFFKCLLVVADKRSVRVFFHLVSLFPNHLAKFVK
jgi:hypothetical protein